MEKYFVMSLLTIMPLSALGDKLPENYVSLKGGEKVELLWNNILETQYDRDSLPALDGSGWGDVLTHAKDFLSNKVDKLGSLNLAPSFDHESDIISEGRVKIIHTYGSVALAAFVPSDNLKDGIISGLLSKSNENILIRLSLAGNPQQAGFTPGMAVKFLIDGKSSRNIFVMPTLEGQGDDSNFFKYSFANDIPVPFEGVEIDYSHPIDALKILSKKALFETIEQYFSFFHETPRHLSIDFLTDVTKQGTELEQSKITSPYILEFRPAYDQISSNSDNDFREDLNNIQPGTTLFKIFAKDSRKEDGVYIGELKTKTEFIASSFGDKTLFFQHLH